jgi:hypothetical protein
LKKEVLVLTRVCSCGWPGHLHFSKKGWDVSVADNGAAGHETVGRTPFVHGTARCNLVGDHIAGLRAGLNATQRVMRVLVTIDDKRADGEPEGYAQRGRYVAPGTRSATRTTTTRNHPNTPSINPVTPTRGIARLDK